MALSFKHIAPFLSSHHNKISRWFGYAGLGMGVLLLLCSVQMYININQLLKDKSPAKTGFDFTPISKTVTNENMGKDNRFSQADIDELKAQPFITDVAPLVSNAFKITAGAGDFVPFSTDIFIEALNTNFIDTVPANFSWANGQEYVPIIVSSEFLEMYNVFAPSWNLPQLSEKTAEALTIFLRCYGHNGELLYKARIVAFSDRVNSILAPESFVKKLNADLEGTQSANSTRVFIKTKDINNPDLLNFLQKKNYRVNRDKIKLGRVKQVLQSIMGGLTGFGVLVILLSMVLFSFYLQLMIARSKENLQLLLTIGYSPKWLSFTVAKRWIPIYTVIIITALVLTAVLQWGFQHFIMNDAGQLSAFINPVIILIAGVLIVLSIAINYRLIKKQLTNL